MLTNWLDKNKRTLTTAKKAILVLIVALSCQTASSASDTITLQMCLDSARYHHPSTKKLPLADRIVEQQKAELTTNYLPQVSLEGRASYQSDVPELQADNLPLETPELPKDQYQGYGKLEQLIYDGGANRSQKEITELDASINQQKVKEQHHKVEAKVIKLYFAKLLAAKNQASIDCTKAALQSRYESLKAAQEAGTATSKDLLMIETELDDLAKQRWRLASQEMAAVAKLSQLTKLPLDTSTHFKLPQAGDPWNKPSITRPKLEHLSLQQEKLMERQDLVAAQRWPNISLAAQGGIGYPNPYNFFDNEVSPFYMIGLNLSWTPWQWGKVAKQQKTLELRSRMIEHQKQSFRQKVRTKLIQQSNKIERLQKLLDQDKTILEKKKEIRTISGNQLEKGVLATTDYIDKVSDVARARLTLDKHRIELTIAQMTYNHIKGQTK